MCCFGFILYPFPATYLAAVRKRLLLFKLCCSCGTTASFQEFLDYLKGDQKKAQELWDEGEPVQEEP